MFNNSPLYIPISLQKLRVVNRCIAKLCILHVLVAKINVTFTFDLLTSNLKLPLHDLNTPIHAALHWGVL
jgi:hypothetical protein